jgi:hypothetical protein
MNVSISVLLGSGLGNFFILLLNFIVLLTF